MATSINEMRIIVRTKDRNQELEDLKFRIDEQISRQNDEGAIEVMAVTYVRDFHIREGWEAVTVENKIRAGKYDRATFQNSFKNREEPRFAAPCHACGCRDNHSYDGDEDDDDY